MTREPKMTKQQKRYEKVKKEDRLINSPIMKSLEPCFKRMIEAELDAMVINAYKKCGLL